MPRSLICIIYFLTLLFSQPLKALAYNTAQNHRPIVGGQRQPSNKPVTGFTPIYRPPPLAKQKKAKPIRKKTAVRKPSNKKRRPVKAKRIRRRPTRVSKRKRYRPTRQQGARQRRIVRRRSYTPPVQARKTTIPSSIKPRTNDLASRQVKPLTPKEAQRFIPKPLAKVLRKTEASMVWPLTQIARISSPFGWRTHPISGQKRLHAGADIAAPLGTPIVAAYSGQVITAGPNGGYGKSILLNHGNFRTRYAHLSALNVKSGDNVIQGQIIGNVGTTGYSTGPHLHLEKWAMQPDGSYQPVNPGNELGIAKVRFVQNQHLQKQQAQ